MIHYLDSYRDGDTRVVFCRNCGKEQDELLATECAGKVEPIVKKGVDTNLIDTYVNSLANTNWR
jgi:hypothetical protein